eukprot:gene215-218_t
MAVIAVVSGLYLIENDLKILNITNVESICVRDRLVWGAVRVVIPAGILANVPVLPIPIKDFLRIKSVSGSRTALWAKVVASRLHVVLRVLKLKSLVRSQVSLSDVFGDELVMISDPRRVFTIPIVIFEQLGFRYTQRAEGLFEAEGGDVMLIQQHVEELKEGKEAG